MARRAAPGDAAALLAALSPSLCAALEELRELLNIVDWQLTPLGPPFQAAAAVSLAIRIGLEGVAPTTALSVAADVLGLERSTVHSWCARWPDWSRGLPHHAGARGRHSVASLIQEAIDATPPEAA